MIYFCPVLGNQEHFHSVQGNQVHCLKATVSQVHFLQEMVTGFSELGNHNHFHQERQDVLFQHHLLLVNLDHSQFLQILAFLPLVKLGLSHLLLGSLVDYQLVQESQEHNLHTRGKIVEFLGHFHCPHKI